MKREILFRGKRLDNGKWVYGIPLYDFADCRLKKDGKCYCTHNGELIDFLAWNDIYHEYADIEVDTDTVNQYTGLRDKNGKRIFEGDIIKSHYANARKADHIEQVVFHNGRFCALDKLSGPGNGKIWADLPDGVPHLPQDKTVYMDHCEVIGNVYDNPELLEVSENG